MHRRSFANDGAVPVIENKIILFEPRPRPYQTPASSIEAFWCLVRLNEPARLEAWLLDHPRDAQFLYKLLQDRKNERS
jgi:hypothetical protein